MGALIWPSRRSLSVQQAGSMTLTKEAIQTTLPISTKHGFQMLSAQNVSFSNPFFLWKKKKELDLQYRLRK